MTLLSRSETLYTVLGIGLIRTGRDRRMAQMQLSPLSCWPRCDWCETFSVPTRQGRGSVVHEEGTRWAFHEPCRDEAKQYAPDTSSLGPFTRWLTLSEWVELCRKLRARHVDLPSLLSGNQPMFPNELTVIWDCLTGKNYLHAQAVQQAKGAA